MQKKKRNKQITEWPSAPFTIDELAERFQRNHEPEMCRHFGCGRQLTSQEGLFGPVCNDHTGEEIINKTLITYLAPLVKPRKSYEKELQPANKG